MGGTIYHIYIYIGNWKSKLETTVLSGLRRDVWGNYPSIGESNGKRTWTIKWIFLCYMGFRGIVDCRGAKRLPRTRSILRCSILYLNRRSRALIVVIIQYENASV